MIKRFNRYILWEIAKLFSIALIAFTTIIMLGGLMQQLVLEGLGPMAILDLLPYLLPIGLQFGLPQRCCLLCAVFMVGSVQTMKSWRLRRPESTRSR